MQLQLKMELALEGHIFEFDFKKYVCTEFHLTGFHMMFSYVNLRSHWAKSLFFTTAHLCEALFASS